MGWLSHRRAELHLAVRITVAGVGAFALAQVLGLPQGYWAVFTAVLVTQASVGGSLNAAFDRLVGTLSGAIYSAIVAIFIPHTDVVMLGLALAVSLAPLAALAAIFPTFRVAPVTAVILLLGNAGAEEGPVLAGSLRTLEVGLGGFVGLIVSMSVLPKRASTVMRETADRLLMLLATLLSDLFNGLLAQCDASAISLQHLQIRSAFDRLEAAEIEWNRERRTFLSGEVDMAPLPRTLRRVYHDLVLLGRIASQPFPDDDTARASPYVARIVETGAQFFRDAGRALLRQASPPASAAFDTALQDLSAAMGGASQSGSHAVLGFAIEQTRRDVRDLWARMQELAKPVTKS